MNFFPKTMKLTDEQKALMRGTLLEQLAAAGRQGLPLNRLHAGCKLNGFTQDAQEVKQQLDYLVTDGTAEELRDELAAGLVRWRITREGQRLAEERGLA